QPVPVSRNGGGVTVVGPRPQFSVTSAPTSAVMSTTAGFTRRMASWTDNASTGVGAASPALANRSAAIKALIGSQRITERAQRTMTAHDVQLRVATVRGRAALRRPTRAATARACDLREARRRRGGEHGPRLARRGGPGVARRRRVLGDGRKRR